MDKVKKWIESNYIILIILFIASLLRFYHIDYQSVWLDEICSINEANPNIKWSDLEATILVTDPHPQLYFIFLKIMFLLFGYTTFVARVFSAIVGVVGVYAMYLLGREIRNKKLGIIAAFLAAINYFHIYYSQEVRMYGLLFLLTVLSFYRLVIFLKSTTYKNAAWYGVYTGLMIFTQFFGLFVLASQLFILFIFLLRLDQKDKRQFIFKSFVSGAIIIIIFAPAINIFIETTKKKYAVFKPTSIDSIKQIFKDFAYNSDLLILISIVLMAVYFILGIKNKWFKNKEVSLMVFVLLSWLLISLILPILRSYLVTPMITSRYFIVILPPILILIALGIASINRKAIQMAAVVLFGVVSFYVLTFHNDYYNKIAKTQFREISEYVIKENTQKDPVVSNLRWYLIYLFNKDESNIPLVDRVFEDYVQDMMKDPEGIESFWYFGAFGNPLKLSEKANAFLEENFAVVHSLDGFDSWTRHYVTKKAENLEAYKIPVNNIVLSSISDTYWTGGVSKNNTILLVDFSEDNVEKLKSARRLKAKNGKSYKIIKTEKTGNFIHIYVDKAPYTNKDMLQYPNPIEFLK